MAINNYIRQQFKVLGWIIFGWTIYSLYIQVINQLYLGHFKNYVSLTAEDIGFDYRQELITTVIVSIIGAAVFGAMELFVLKYKFKNVALGKKLFYKGLIYAITVFGLIWFGSLFYNTLRTKSSPFDGEVLMAVKDFTTSTGFWGNFMFIYMGIALTLIFLTINEQLGPGRLKDLVLGKYSKAIKERRIFMFLDIQSSTEIAEKLGHEKYFRLLNKFFYDITEAILQFEGKIYQYVGDEIVVSWPVEEKEQNHRCLFSFRKMQEAIDKESEHYIREFGQVPVFKAGFHCGEVTSGEVGLIKKDIIHTGDVLNTTARIEKKCNSLNQRCLISCNLVNELPNENPFRLIEIGNFELRGREKQMSLFSLEWI